MIIQCEKCQTKFRLDDSKVTDKGVKVRCAKCKHVFTVKSDEPSVADTPLSVAAAPPAPSDAESDVFGESSFAAEPSVNAPTAGSTLFGDAPSADSPADYSSFETSSFDASAISFESDELDVTGTEAADTASVSGGEVDFSGFDFGDSSAEPDQTTSSSLSREDFTDEPLPASAAVREKETPQGLDFSDDDMFGAVVESTPEQTTDAITFDFGEDSFAESMDAGSSDTAGKSGTLFSLDAPAETPFNLGEIDFGDELTSVAVQQVNPDDLKPSQELLFAPLAEARVQEQGVTSPEDEELARSFMDEDSSAGQELPPLSIASRRKQSPLFNGVIAVVALLVVSVLGYLGYSSFSAPKGAAPQESGKISVRGVKAAFVNNDEAGELLVVSGEALNEYAKPRAALQVKVTVFDPTGQSVATKSAYGGNPLTDEQLESMPLDKLEAAMANQFGDSLANMEVGPGKAIPFVVVLAKLPKGAKDFAVQPVGSTVATGKQQ